MSARSIIVTGGFGALGRVVARAFAAQGDRVARVDFASAPGEAAAGMLDFGDVDLTDAARAGKVVADVTAAHGGVDGLVNVAGGFTWQTLADGDLATWRRMFAMNVLTAATMTKAALPRLKASAGGRVVNIGAGAAVQAAAGMGAYAASKAGVHRLTESLAAELAGSPRSPSTRCCPASSIRPPIAPTCRTPMSASG